MQRSLIPESWDQDVLDRKKYADFLTHYLSSRTDPFVINLNAEWGQGKTFFLTLWKKDVAQKHPTIFVNAWETDYSDDPLVAFISAFNDQISALLPAPDLETKQVKEFEKKAVGLVKAVAPTILKGLTAKLIGNEAVDELVSKISEEIILNAHQKQNDAIKEFQSSFVNLMDLIQENKEISKPMFVFIDELDRCRPSYAIEMLENIKHFFSIDNLVFIVATDTKQLQHSIRALYGLNFDSSAYLRRFFHREYALPNADYKAYADILVQEHHILDAEREHQFIPQADFLSDFFALFSEFFRLSLRDQEQCFAEFDAIITSVVLARVYFPFLFFVIILHFKHPDLFELFFHRNADPVIHELKQYNLTATYRIQYPETHRAWDFIDLFLRLYHQSQKDLRMRIDNRNQKKPLEKDVCYGMVCSKEGVSYRDLVLLVGGLS
jgi:hypothetical protein